ncbi:MAG: thymidine kinase [Planctomycetota bacterium]
MAKLYFYYSTMNAGKSTILLQNSYNYRERGMRSLILLPEIDTRDGSGQVTSRIGLASPATTFTTADQLFTMVEEIHRKQTLHCVLVDESQFLTKQQVRQLSDVCDQLDVPVMAYGLRTDFQGNLFTGSEALLAWADTLTEIKTICHCGRKATMVLRIDSEGRPVKDGRQIQIGGNERYVPVCRLHFKQGMTERAANELPLLDGLEDNVDNGNVGE